MLCCQYNLNIHMLLHLLLLNYSYLLLLLGNLQPQTHHIRHHHPHLLNILHYNHIQLLLQVYLSLIHI